MKTFAGFTTEFKELAICQSVGIGLMILTALTMGVHRVEAATPVGVKLMVQPWDPIRDDDSVTTLYDSNDAITSAINGTWDKVKPKLIDSITAQLSTPNLLAEGVSLYGVKLNINTPELSIAPDGNNGFVAKLLVRDTYLETTSTTPDIAFGIGLGSYADPRCSIRFSLELTLKLGVTDDKTRLLEARYGPNDAPVVVKDFKADSQNVPCDIAKFLASDVAKLLAGKDFWKWMTDEINNPKRKEYRELNDTIKQALNAGLVPVNAQLNLPAKYAQYAQYARTGLWANKNKLTVLFGVRELPLPARTASATGRLKIGDLKGLALPINGCDQLRLSAKVKTGPRLVIDPLGSLGAAPMVDVGKLRGSALAAPATGQSCDYTVDQLVPGFPNLLKFTVSQETTTRNRNSTEVYVMGVRPEGWAYDKALHPQPSVGNLNLTLLVANVGTGGLRPQYERADAIRQDPLTDAGIKPNSGALINQGNAISPASSNRRASGSSGVKSPLNSAPSALSGNGAARLNPQPLPPLTGGVPNAGNSAPR